MSVADYIEKLAATSKGEAHAQPPETPNVLKDLEEVESTLRDIGVTLEPRFFDISLTSRIGLGSRR